MPLWLRQSDAGQQARSHSIGQHQVCSRPTCSLCACRHAGAHRFLSSSPPRLLSRNVGTALRRQSLASHLPCACRHAGAHVQHKKDLLPRASSAPAHQRVSSNSLRGIATSTSNLQVRTCVKPPSPAPFTAPVEQRKLLSNNRHIAFDASNDFSIAYRYACEQKLACERSR